MSARQRPVRGAMRIAAALAVAFLLWKMCASTAFEGVRVASESMAGTLLVGDRVVANKIVYGARLPLLATRARAVQPVRPGDVILFRHPDDPSQLFIKRCVAVAGQTVSADDGQVLVDGRPCTRTPLEPVALGSRSVFGPAEVPAGMMFVLGDNASASWDSRDWGFLPTNNVVGKAEVVFWSRDPAAKGLGIRWKRIGARVR